jgi:hypothetical protein
MTERLDYAVSDAYAPTAPTGVSHAIGIAVAQSESRRLTCDYNGASDAEVEVFRRELRR